jgi:hypothetical protein
MQILGEFMQPPSDEKKIGLWKKTYRGKSGEEKTMLTGHDGEFQYTIFTNDYKSEEKHPDYRLTIKPREAKVPPAPTMSAQVGLRQHNAHRPHTEEDLPF